LIAGKARLRIEARAGMINVYAKVRRNFLRRRFGAFPADCSVGIEFAEGTAREYFFDNDR
jgi:hypothetical protein